MVMSRSTAVGSIVVGTIELTFGIITIICGSVAVSKLSGNALASAGLWALYYAVPAFLTIAAGASKNTIVMAFALFFNIIGVIVSLGAAGGSIGLTIVLGNLVTSKCHQIGDTCSCLVYDSGPDTTSTETYDMQCSDIDTLHNIMIALVVVFVILTIVTLTASIYGCIGTCCVPADPIVIIAGGVGVQGGSSIVVQSNQSTMHGYPALPRYTEQCGDGNRLVKNMVI